MTPKAIESTLRPDDLKRGHTTPAAPEAVRADPMATVRQPAYPCPLRCRCPDDMPSPRAIPHCGYKGMNFFN